MCTSNLAAVRDLQPLFPLGDIVVTPRVLALLRKYDLHPIKLLARHVHGDWGDASPADIASNRQALNDEGRLLSAYTLASGERLWVITECDRSVTTLLLPDEA